MHPAFLLVSRIILSQLLIQLITSPVPLTDTISPRIRIFPAEFIIGPKPDFFPLQNFAGRDRNGEIESGGGAVACFHDIQAHFHVGKLPDQVKSCAIVAGQVPAT